ncbi:alkanesulfonate monooxygenase SsuD/methylene tetrahydromethanopterin reductase-like flavin-dependent oxidoreductase (luciferase family) [Curtobacterium sp. PhB130]|uniref:LLM class flavin-dependent oxidoreductase n=1 Tax=Curtobacterium sp. PhB130 TaxID=2485178 RepID=UPI000F4CD178|nr:LLM class flavin-dependent oxidoreductase [Curtobacterium sp. PhB130]ROS73087.1 alkanesulfonate monooxygenase SsuD/methylene tetrahydromethanopterin reductase-like flavin-dependent oxidoreductase (luciferase family) [Curtobacterium sp. PhB130]
MADLQHFGYFFSRGFGPQAWGRSDWDWGHDWTKPDLYQQSVRALEQAGMDLVIAEDAISLGNPSTLDLRIRQAYGGPKHDPLLLAPYLFAATSHIGIAPTVNAGITPPYLAARQFATLAHLSSERLGINVVTDVGSARHAGLPPLPHDQAYDRAEEWITLLRRFWHSWGSDGYVGSRPDWHFADGHELDAFHHEGAYFTADGPLNALPLDSDPIVVSPGGSGRGLGFAGTHSDVQLALAPLSASAVSDYRARVLSAAADAGRSPDELRILFVLKPEIAVSPEEADRIVEASLHPSDDDLRTAAIAWSSDSETDLLALDLDAPIPAGTFGDHVSAGTIRGLVGDTPDAPLRELLTRKARKGRVSSRSGFVGTAGEFADFIEELGADAENDGIIFSGDLHPAQVYRMFGDLVPVLRQRGLLRREYGAGGIRANLFDF